MFLGIAKLNVQYMSEALKELIAYIVLNDRKRLNVVGCSWLRHLQFLHRLYKIGNVQGDNLIIIKLSLGSITNSTQLFNLFKFRPC